MRIALAILCSVSLLAGSFAPGLRPQEASCCVTSSVNDNAGCCCGTAHDATSPRSCCAPPTQPVNSPPDGEQHSCPSDGSCPCAPLGCGCQPAHVIAAILPVGDLLADEIEAVLPDCDESLSTRCDVPPLPPPKLMA